MGILNRGTGFLDRVEGAGIISSGSSAYTQNVVNFPSTLNLHRNGSLTGEANTDGMLLSLWYLRNADDNNAYPILGTNVITGFNEPIRIRQLGSGAGTAYGWNVRATDSAGTTVHGDSSANTYDGKMEHFLLSISIASNKVRAYVNGAVTKSTTAAGINIGFNNQGTPDWDINKALGQTTRPGYYADFWFRMTTSFVDIDDAAIRAKFISGGKPVDLGDDGTEPGTGTPHIFLGGSMKAADWEAAGNNQGSGGDFVVEGTGNITDVAAPPYR